MLELWTVGTGTTKTTPISPYWCPANVLLGISAHQKPHFLTFTALIEKLAFALSRIFKALHATAASREHLHVYFPIEPHKNGVSLTQLNNAQGTFRYLITPFWDPKPAYIFQLALLLHKRQRKFCHTNTHLQWYKKEKGVHFSRAAQSWQIELQGLLSNLWNPQYPRWCLFEISKAFAENLPSTTPWHLHWVDTNATETPLRSFIVTWQVLATQCMQPH